MLIPMGILAASGAGIAGSYELISTTTLTSTSSSVTLTSGGAWAGYKHLQVRVVTAANTAGVPGIFATFNGDSGANYAYHNLQGFNSSVTSSGQTYKTFMYLGDFNGNAVTNAFGANIIDILDASSTSKFKTVRTLAGAVGNSTTTGLVALKSSLWGSTSAITSFTMTPTASSFAIGSRFSIYGIKGA